MERFRKTETNRAGYARFERVRTDNSQKSEKRGMSRRGFMGFLAKGAVGTAAVMHAPKLFTNDGVEVEAGTVPDYDEEALHNLLQQQEAEERETTEQFFESVHFNERVDEFLHEYEADMDYVREYGGRITVNDPEGRSRIQYVSQELQVDGVSPIVLAELRDRIDGLCFVESRFDAERVSRDGARGVMQIVPSTWDEHGNPTADPLSLVAQVEAAGSLFSQIHRHLQNECRDEMALIRAEFFHGNEEEFERYFLTPVLINGYNAGAGNMELLLKGFARAYGTQELAEGIFDEGKTPSGYDVFFAMVCREDTDNWASRYAQHASQYTPRVYSADRCLRLHLPETPRA